MNKKGFTTVEVVISFALVAIILISLTKTIVVYRDRVTTEEVKTQLLDYKNTITKLVYDDIIIGSYKKVEYCVDDMKCVKFINEDNSAVTLRAITNRLANASLGMGIFLEYKDNKVMLPDSDLNKYNAINLDSEKYLVNINDFILTKDEDKGIYKVIIPIYHSGIRMSYDIKLIVS